MAVHWHWKRGGMEDGSVRDAVAIRPPAGSPVIVPAPPSAAPHQVTTRLRAIRTDRREKINQGFAISLVRQKVAVDDMLVRSRTRIAKNMSHDVAVTAA
ncbi:hypothetical protein [Sphingomonas asaccharolytica]|uniref:hypothetical protein n=1 Tax=Sphingomonas asaccharolytica TaxID=40681 RepID=UPI00082E30A4|nr:hypothetical protein [Sphingomonas asaccharolytica]